MRQETFAFARFLRGEREITPLSTSVLTEYLMEMSGGMNDGRMHYQRIFPFPAVQPAIYTTLIRRKREKERERDIRDVK